MGLIKGIPIVFYERLQVGYDDFGAPVYEEIPVLVENVLVAPAQVTEMLSETNLTGSKAVYKIAIPKSDTHIWRGKKVEFFGQIWRVIGEPQRGIHAMIPLEWGDIWEVERYGE